MMMTEETVVGGWRMLPLLAGVAAVLHGGSAGMNWVVSNRMLEQQAAAPTINKAANVEQLLVRVAMAAKGSGDPQIIALLDKYKLNVKDGEGSNGGGQ
jgi:hypothetical protein